LEVIWWIFMVAIERKVIIFNVWCAKLPVLMIRYMLFLKKQSCVFLLMQWLYLIIIEKRLQRNEMEGRVSGILRLLLTRLTFSDRTTKYQG